MFSFRSLALIVLGAPFLSACIENACKSDEHQDVSFCPATDMSMSQSADDKAGDMATPMIECKLGTSNSPDCTCTLQFGTGGLSVKGVAMKRVDMNSSRLALLLEGGMSTIVDIVSINNACSVIGNQSYNVTTTALGESSMAANRSLLLFARDKILASSPWDLGYVNYSQKLTGKHLSVASNVKGDIYAMIAETPGIDMALMGNVSASKSYEFVGDNLASGISADSNGKIAIGVNDELLVWTGTGTGYKYAKSKTDPVYGANKQSVQNLSVCNGKLCPVGVGDVSHDAITDLVTADSGGIHVYKGSSDLGQFTDITSNYAKIITHLNMAKNVQAIAVAIPSGESFNASDPPRLVWATAGNGTNANQTKVTVNMLPLLTQ